MKKTKMIQGTGSIPPDYLAINERALLNIGEVLESLNLKHLEGGKYDGVQFRALNPHRDDHNVGSFSLNTETGVWADFATDDKGGDLVSYWKFVKKFKFQSEAARDLEKFLDSLECMEGYPSGPSEPLAGVVIKPTVPAVREAPRPAGSIPQSNTSTNSGNLWTPVLPDNVASYPSQPHLHPMLGEPVFSFRYRNPEGKLLGRIDAFGPPNARSFRPLTFWVNAEGNVQWRWEEFQEPWPLYGLELLVARPEAEVVICEGEEAADAARELLPGCVVTTPMYGGSCPSKTDLTPLRGRYVTIWPTCSAAGALFSEEMHELLDKIEPGKPIRFLNSLCFHPGMNGISEAVLLPRNELPDGWDASWALQECWTSRHMALVWSNPGFFSVTNQEVRLGQYLIRPSGVFEDRKSDGKTVRVKICSYLKPLAQTRDASSQNWGLLLELTDADRKTHRWAMPSRLLALQGYPFMQSLVNLGLKMGFNESAKAEVAKFLNEVEVQGRALCVTQQGWHQQVFVTTDGMVGPSEELVVVQGDNPDAYREFRTQGTHADWIEKVARPCQGNTRLVFGVCAALTSPALYWLNEENGGFHLRGNSSIGKTVALQVAVSVWGGPDFLQRWRATANGLEGTATKFNDTFLALDEISQVDANAAGETAYMLGNGQGKVRATTSGTARPVARWRLVFLSTGEVTLSDHAAAVGRRTLAGQETRMVNIPADAGTGLGLFDTIHDAASATIFAETLRANAGEYFGTAGPLWVALLADAQRREIALATIGRVKASFVRDYVVAESAGQVFRAAGRFGLVAAVGEACIAAGILPWTAGEAIAAARQCFLAWIEHRGGTESLEAEAAVRQVRRFIENHGESRFTPWEETKGDDGYDGFSRTVNRAGFRRRVDDDSIRYYTYPEVFKREICQGHDAKEVAKVLVERGFLIPGNDGKPSSSHRLPGHEGTSRIYLITSAILSGERDSRIAGDGQSERIAVPAPETAPAPTIRASR